MKLTTHGIAPWCLIVVYCQLWAVPTYAQKTAPDSSNPTAEAPPSSAAETSRTTELPEVLVSADQERDGTAESGYRSGTATLGLLGDKPLQEVPYAISVTPHALIENLQASRPTEALRYEPTVNPEMGSNRNGDYLAIRGFINSSNQAIDGMRSSVAAGGWLQDKERVEVMNGATSFLYGIASPAGMVNYVLKRPTVTPLLSITVGDYGGAQGYAHVDAGGPLDKRGRFGYRLNALGVVDGNTGVSHERDPRVMLSGAFDWHINEGTRLSIDASHYQHKLKYAQAYFFVNNITSIPDAPDASKNYAAPYSIAQAYYDTQGIELTSQISQHLSVRSALRHGRVDQRFSSLRDRLVDNAGNYTQEMMYYGSPNVTNEVRGNVFVDLNFHTGPVNHELTAGYIGSWTQSSAATTQTYKFPESNLFSLDSPGYQPNPEVDTSSHAYTTQKAQQHNVLLADNIHFTESLSALVGASWTALNDKNYSSDDGTRESAYDKQAISPSLALMYKPLQKLMVYASHIQALEEGGTAPSTAVNHGEVLKPYLSTQYELGTKLSLGHVDLKAALFRIERETGYTDPDTNIFAAAGRQVHRGAEFSFVGKVFEPLTLLGGFSLLDAELTKTSKPTLQGKTPQAVPDKIARLYGEYALPLRGLVLIGGISYVSKMWADDLNTLSYPGVATGDVGLRYVASLAGHTLSCRVNISNVTDNNYWTSKGGSMLYLGSPRTLSASLTFQL